MLFRSGCKNAVDGPATKKSKDYTSYFKAAKEYCKQNKLNTSWFMLADLSIHSGKKRFYVYNFESGNFTDTFLVSHGCGNHKWLGDETKESPAFSNIEESHCSALGKYILRDRGVSIFGVKTKYLLEGVDESNNKAMKRAIVFHSLDEINDEEVYPKGAPEGWGCPAVSNHTFTEIDKRLKKIGRAHV